MNAKIKYTGKINLSLKEPMQLILIAEQAIVVNRRFVHFSALDSSRRYHNIMVPYMRREFVIHLN
jgi:hypothetical protein